MARINALSILIVMTSALAPVLASAQPVGPTRPSLDAGAATTRGGASVAGPLGAEWSIPGGARVKAEPGAVLRVLHTAQPLQFSPGAAVPGYTLIVRSGKVEVSVPAPGKSAVVVVAPRQLGAIVRSGVLRIAALADSSAMANISGVTTLSVGGGGYRELAVGQVHVATGSSSAARALIASPRVVNGPRLVIAGSGGARFAGLSWNAVAGAIGYHAVLVDERTGKTLEAVDVTEAALDRPFEALPVGRYRLRVTALDSSGIAGSNPVESPLRVVGIALPPGAYADATGSLRLGRGQSVQFQGVEGLEMNYGGPRFVRATPAVGLYRNERTLVQLRLPGSSAVATARLAPRTVRARIELGPRGATWPKDPIEIRVRLEDPSGEAIPEWLEAKPRVQLGVREIAVPFTREGGWLKGVVRPRTGAGPWVLRVAVEDGAAQSLGYDFVEISSASQGSGPTARLDRPRAISRR